ncbi:MAG TPA: nitroreductase family protein [Candidatus Nitrosotalea sp.]|nr:nitroreductase family protein [Candidatus Nitrosotalea sp.]
MIDPEVQKTRKAEFEVNAHILNRWSPRSFTGEEINDKELFSLFEAARWAPSSFNNQPWRFVYAKKNSPHWALLFNLLADSNKQWCEKASALAVVVSLKTFEHNGKPSFTHQFDAGAAWQNLAIQATTLGLATHGMAGFDYEKARKDLGVPEGYEVMAMIAIGRRGPKESLPSELQKREAPSGRKPLGEILMEGKFGNKPGLP